MSDLHDIEEKEARERDIFCIPANFTDSGLFFGLFTLRNLIEASILCISISLIVWYLTSYDVLTKILVIVFVCVPIGFISAIGYQGDSVSQTIKRIFTFFKNKKKVRYRRIKKDVPKKEFNIARVSNKTLKKKISNKK